MRLINLEGSENTNSLYDSDPVMRLRIGLDLSAMSPLDLDETFTALIDTGATNSSIDTTVARQLELPAIGDPEQHVGANGPFQSQPVLALIQVLDLDVVAYRRFATLPLIEHDLDYHAILGRDFLSQVVFNYDGPAGVFEMSLPQDQPTD